MTRTRAATRTVSRFAALTAVLAAGVSLYALPAAAQGEIRVAWYGGNWGEAFRTCVAEPFTKATGVRVVPEIGTSTVTFAKLQQQKDAPTLDVAYMDGGISEMAQGAGVLDAIDPTGVPNLAKALPEAIYKADGSIFAVGSGYYSLGLTYNTKEIKTPPTSWNDLWKPEFADTVTIPSPANSSGVPFVMFLNRMWGNPPGDLSKTFEKLKTLKTALYFDSSGAASNAYQSGEAIIGAHFNVGAWDLADKGLPIGFAVPKEGVWATDARLHLVKNAPHKADAQRFIDTALTPEASACLAEKLYLGPAVQNVSVSPDVERKLPWGVGGSVKNLQLFNWADINRDRAAITDAWNRELARQ